MQEITYFSYDDKHEFYPDERSLRYYHPPTLGADLSKGFESFQELDDTADDHLDDLLRAIVSLEQNTDTRCGADFVTWRGMMTKVRIPMEPLKKYQLTFQKIMITPFRHDGWVDSVYLKSTSSALNGS